MNFYTIFPADQELAFVKDVGSIPYQMSKMGYDAHFVSYIKPDSSNYYQQQVSGLNIDLLLGKMPKAKIFPTLFDRNVVKYLFSNARKIDILNLYFLKHSIIHGCIYKILNPKGILYIKLDLNTNKYKKAEHVWYGFLAQWCYSFYIHHVVDKVSAESQEGVRYMRERFNLSDRKLFYLPNGVDDALIESIQRKDFSQKENIILTVGRIGAFEKNNEVLLDSLRNVRWQKDWRVYFVGSIEYSFKQKIQEFYSETHLENRVIFTGSITDRRELFEYYNRAKVFCLTSRWEGFCISMVEAYTFGNYIISTPLQFLDDFIQDESLGAIINDSDELTNVLNQIMDGKRYDETVYDSILSNAEMFHYSKIGSKLYKELNR